MDPQNETLFKFVYLYSQGPIGLAHYMFREKIVYTNSRFMISAIMHFVPLLVMWHLRWNTIPAFEHLPAGERRFGTIESTPDLNSVFYRMIVEPTFGWIVYLICHIPIVIMTKEWLSRHPDELSTMVYS